MVLTDVFISYSRKDSEFVDSLNNSLTKIDKNVWIDWEDIPYSARWWDEITEAVEGTNAFISVLSQDYFASKTCIEELVMAEKGNKRIIPILYREFDPRLNSSNSISKINWLFFRDSDDFDHAFNMLLEILNKDLDWVKFHTRLLVRALEWSNKNNDASYHLYGKDLEEAQSFVQQAVNKTPFLNTLQKNYIEASQGGAVNLQRKQLRGFYMAAFIYSIAQVFVIYFWSASDLSETAMVKLSWVWLPALAFSIAGFSIGKHSLKRSFVTMAVVMVLFFLFFELLWPSL